MGGIDTAQNLKRLPHQVLPLKAAHPVAPHPTVERLDPAARHQVQVLPLVPDPAAHPPVQVLRPVLTVAADPVLHRHPVQVAPPRPVQVLRPAPAARPVADYLMATLPPVPSLVALPAPVARRSLRQLPPCPVQAAAIYKVGYPIDLNPSSLPGICGFPEA